jgi:2-methylcitrate dehydratase
MAQLLSPSSSLQSGKQTQTAVERIAAFVAAAQPEQLRPEIRQLFKRNILDSIGCAIAALPGPPFTALREQFKEYRAPDHCTLIDGGKTSADQAALYNSGLVRYVDLLDSYMSPGGLCHPSDNFGAVLAAAGQAEATGEELMLALAVAHQFEAGGGSFAISFSAIGSTKRRLAQRGVSESPVETWSMSDCGCGRQVTV